MKPYKWFALYFAATAIHIIITRHWDGKPDWPQFIAGIFIGIATCFFGLGISAARKENHHAK